MMPVPTPPPVEGVTWRPAEPGDAGAIARLQDACFEVDDTYREVESEILDRFDDPEVDAPTDSLIAVRDDGVVLVSIWSYLSTTAESKWRAFADVHVHPDHRTDAMYAFALDWWEERSRRRLAERDDTMAKVLWFSAYSHERELIERMEARGFTIRRYYDELIRDLADPIDRPDLPPGMRFVPAEEAIAGHELAVHNEAFRDHWGSQPFTQERWDHFKNEFYLPEASYVVYDGDRPVGHVMSGTWPHDYEDRGFTHSWILSLGVVPSHRRRGIASAMIARAMGDFSADGMEYAMLDVDSENPTGAYGLYEDLGFVHARRTVALIKEAVGRESRGAR